MITNLIRRAANIGGMDIHRFSKANWRWSYDVDDYYPVDPTPRWGYGKAPHPQITEKLSRLHADISALIRQFVQYNEILASISVLGNSDSGVPYWKNDWFENFDAAALVGMLIFNAPGRYLEIGSGNSTKFARHAIEQARLATSVISFDPEPRAAIDALCDKIIRGRLEDCDLALFDQLEAGDMLFFDGSHRAFTNTDVTVFFLELMPRLKPGVIIHIHDIFLPWDYLPEWRKRMYSEQYMLAAMLLCPQPPFKVLLPNLYACKDAELSTQVHALLNPLGCIAQGWSFWMVKV